MTTKIIIETFMFKKQLLKRDSYVTPYKEKLSTIQIKKKLNIEKEGMRSLESLE